MPEDIEESLYVDKVQQGRYIYRWKRKMVEVCVCVSLILSTLHGQISRPLSSSHFKPVNAHGRPYLFGHSAGGFPISCQTIQKKQPRWLAAAVPSRRLDELNSARCFGSDDSQIRHRDSQLKRAELLPAGLFSNDKG